MRPIANLLLPDALTIVTVRHGRNRGLRIPIYPRLEKFYWTGTYEVELQQALWELLGSGGVFWDIGAHIGFFSSLASRKVGSSGRVVALEPFAPNRRRLEAVLALNDLVNVELLPVAILEEAGKGVFLPSSSSLMGSVVRRPAGDITVESLDGLLQQLPTPDVIKIDVEGNELDVLRGGIRVATETSAVFLVEFTGAKVVEDARSVLPGHAFEALSDRRWLLKRAA